MHPLLIVDDEKLELKALGSILEEAGCEFNTAGTLKEGREKLSSNRYSLALIDFQLPDGTGNDLLKWAKTRDNMPVFFMMSAYGNIPRAVEALKLGAGDFFEKPIDKSRIMEIVKKHSHSPPDARNLPDIKESYKIICDKNSPLNDALLIAMQVADKTCNVFLQGESGTGKEILARLIHNLGPRSTAPLISVNCAAIPDNLLESELFGYRKGAFTGANKDFQGRIEQANGGTLFLDEIGDMPLGMQTKLLRVFQEKTVTPIGSNSEISLDFRLICATHKNLKEEVEHGQFREDLFFRIHVIPIEIPPLRDRRMDIPLLLKAFLSEYLPEEQVLQATAQLPSFFNTHQWPGNIRELKNLAERYSVIHEMGKSWEDALIKSGPVLKKKHEDHAGCSAASELNRITRKPTDREILAALKKCDGHREKAAELLGISRRTLQYHLASIKRNGTSRG